MLGLAFAGLAVAAEASADAIPDDPRQLHFEPRPFTPPDGGAYRHQLANGIPVYVAVDHSLPLVEVAVAARAGAWLDPPGQVGLAALTAAMMRRGGTARLSADQLDLALDRLAAEVDASAGALRSGAHLDAPSWVLEEALDLFCEMLRAPRFEPARLQVARANMLDSMARRGDEPLDVLGREWSWLLWGREHFTTRPLTPATLVAIDRRALLEFHRRVWHPGNLVIAVSGDVEPAAMVAALDRRLGDWPAQEPAPWPPPPPPQRFAPGLYHVERDLPQAKIAIGHLGAQRDGWADPDFFALAVMNELLGGGELVSRIGGRLRTVEGLAYQAGSHFEVGDDWPGDFQIFVETDNPTAALAVELALEEVERLRRRAPSAEELRLAQRSLVEVLPYAFDTAAEVAGHFAEDELLGRPHAFWQRYAERVEAVTAADVVRVARQFLHPDRVMVLTVGRWREIEAGDPAGRARAADLGLGPVHHLPRRDPLTLEALP